MEKEIYTVGQINNKIKNLIEGDKEFNNVCIKGEISNLKYHSSGHIYFSLKDSSGVIRAVMFKSSRLNGLKFQMSDGDQVLVTGRIGVYEPAGAYQLYASKITRDGIGLLYQRFEQLKVELKEMGLFDDMYKKPLPRFALNIGVVTSPTGAAIQDIKNVIGRRNPYASIYLYPAQVQGEGAMYDIISGINYLDQMNLDVIIVGRGGGSIEDLWCFNEKEVAQAIFNCNTPIISGVGHEIDFTIADFVADKRAATPSAAAEIATFLYDDYLSQVEIYKSTLKNIIENKITEKRNKADNLEQIIKQFSPLNNLKTKEEKVNSLKVSLENIMNSKLDGEKKKLDNRRLYLDSISDTMKNLMSAKLDNCKHKFEMYSQQLESLSPLKKISGGYAFVTDDNGKNIVSVDNVSSGDDINIVVNDGKIIAKVENTLKEEIYGS